MDRQRKPFTKRWWLLVALVCKAIKVEDLLSLVERLVDILRYFLS